MKVYTRVVVDMASGQIEEADCYEYNGPVDLCKGKGKAPKAPDYTAAAEAQSKSSKEVTNMQNYANRPDQITPWGGVKWAPEAITDPATGQVVTKWTQTETLSPVAQEALEYQMDLQRGKSKLGQGFMGRVEEAYKDPFSYEGMPERAGTPEQTTQAQSPEEFAAERRRIEDALFERMAPEHQRASALLEQQLASQGLTPGSEAYIQAKKELGDQQSRERFNALSMGGQEQQRLQQMALAQQGQAYGQGMQGAGFQNTNRQAAIAEEAQRRGMSLNELNAIMTGQQVQNPQMPGFIGASAAQPVNYLGAAQGQYQAALDAYNAKQAQGQGMMSGLFGLGASALGSYFGGPAGARSLFG